MNTKIVTIALSAMVALAMLGASAADTAQRGKRRPAGMIKPSGGLIIDKPTGKSICLLNTSKLITAAELEKASKPVLMQIRCPFVVVDALGDETLDDKVAAAKGDAKVAFVIPLVDALDNELLSYFPSRELCVVNVRPLAEGTTDREKVVERLTKQLWRSTGIMLGAGESIGGYSVLRRVATVEQLDANKNTNPTPLQHNAMVDGLTPYGIKMVRIASYRTACEKGWAPPPANDEQKAIWEEVHALPTEPIKIKPETKKVTE